MRYPYIIVDTDRKAVESIQIALEEHIDYICTGIAKNQEEAVNLILERKPALVFLEPEVPGTLSPICSYFIIDELKKYTNELPEFIVVTETEKYAIEGIRNQVLDYITKPSKKTAVRKALMRYENRNNSSQDRTLCFKSYGDYRFINIDDVLYLKADNNTTDFVMNNGNTVEAYKTLKQFQNTLPKHFVRIHNSYIINTNYVSRIHFGKAKCAIKNSKEMIPFSRSYKTKVEEIRDNLAQNSMIQL
ncbi:LytR/AlgR family response regulator transcription factor [Aquimarina rhabdastrellae]